jgi:hypothetical protein
VGGAIIISVKGRANQTERKNKKTFKKLLTNSIRYDIIKSSKGERNQKKKT